MRAKQRPGWLLLPAAALALLLAGWLIVRLPAAAGLALALLLLPLLLFLILRETGRALPGELHLARAILGLRTSRAPGLYVRCLFDSYAHRYDRHLFADLDYRVPNALRDLVGEPGTGLAVADLGCGTGALGPLFRRLARRLDGVDLSPAMLDRARARGVYDALVEADLLAFLQARPGAYDLLLAADVLPYLGDPRPLLAAARTALRPGGRLAFSAERQAAALFALTRSGRFAHDPDGLAALAGMAGFAVERWEQAVLRREAGRPVDGFVMLLKKSSS